MLFSFFLLHARTHGYSSHGNVGQPPPIKLSVSVSVAAITTPGGTISVRFDTTANELVRYTVVFVSAAAGNFSWHPPPGPAAAQAAIAATIAAALFGASGPPPNCPIDRSSMVDVAPWPVGEGVCALFFFLREVVELRS